MNHAIALAYFSKITPLRYKKLLDCFGNIEAVWKSSATKLAHAGLDVDIAQEFVTWRKTVKFEKIISDLEKEKITALPLGHKNYPRLLSKITDPPLVLFVRGTLPPPTQPTIAVVGTRKFTNYGRFVTEEISTGLASSGVVVVSGLALGIDGIAHVSTLNASGVTIAVLGSGIDNHSIHPTIHLGLAKRIIKEGGAVVSEYPPGFMPTQYSFPMRNRIIAGLSRAVVVTEAPAKSGALITAWAALDYNRDVYAIPHPITSLVGVGGNNLIKLGAKLITSAQDVLEELNIAPIKLDQPEQPSKPTHPTEALILPHLGQEPSHIDEIIKKSGLESGAVMGALTMLEIQGKIKHLGGGCYALLTRAP